MEAVKWETIPVETITQGVERQVLWGDQANLARLSLAKGTHVSKHAHPAEQFTCVLSGALRVDLGGRELRLSAGELIVIPGEVAHEVWALEDTIVWDFFAPPRHDWKTGRSAYLAGE